MPIERTDIMILCFRLPGNNFANVVFIPSRQDPDISEPVDDILQSLSALRFFQRSDVQQSIKDLNNKEEVLIVEEIKKGNERTYVITTIKGKRVFPINKNSNHQRDTSHIDDEDAWNAFVGIIRGQFNQDPVHFSARSGEANRKNVQLSLPIENFQSRLTSSHFTNRHSNNEKLTPGTFVHGSSRSIDSDRFFERSPSTRSSVIGGRRQFSPKDEFDPDSFNPFVPFTDGDSPRGGIKRRRRGRLSNRQLPASFPPNFRKRQTSEESSIVSITRDSVSSIPAEQHFTPGEELGAAARGDLRNLPTWPWVKGFFLKDVRKA